MRSCLMRIAMMVGMISLASCYTQNKALKAVKKANFKHPEVVAEFTRQNYPCIDGRIDTLVKYDTSYEFIEIDCGDAGPQVDTPIIMIQTKFRYITKKVAIPSKTVYITKKVEDSAKISILTAQIANLKADNDKLSQTAAKRKIWLYSFLKALIVSILLNIFFIYRKNGAINKLR